MEAIWEIANCVGKIVHFCRQIKYHFYCQEMMKYEIELFQPIKAQLLHSTWWDYFSAFQNPTLSVTYKILKDYIVFISIYTPFTKLQQYSGCMSDSCPAAHHKSCFTSPCSRIPLLFSLLCFATWPCKAHSSFPLPIRLWVLLMPRLILGRWAEQWQQIANAKAVTACPCDLNPLLAIHHFLQYDLHNLHPLGTEMCWGKQRAP